QLTVTGTSGSLTHTTTVTLVVNAASDFVIGASPASASVTPGGSANYTITIAAQGGFNGSVSRPIISQSPVACASFYPASIIQSALHYLIRSLTAEYDALALHYALPISAHRYRNQRQSDPHYNRNSRS